MKNKDFKTLLNDIHNFNTLQFRKLKEEVEIRVKKKKVSNILENSREELICPHCNSKHFIMWGKRNDMQRYKCKNCNRTFNSLTQTPLARLRKKGHWLEYSRCLKEGLTIRKAAQKCGVHKNTSFRWRHRFIDNLKHIKAKKIGGIIESEILILKESFKGSKKFKNENHQNRKDVHIVYFLDRNNNISDITNKGFSIHTLDKEIRNKIIKDSLIYSKNSNILSQFTKENKLKHICISNKKHTLSHINKASNYKEKFHKWILNHFRGVATKYLENYVSWYRSLNEFYSGINNLTILYRAKNVEKYRHQPLKVTRFI